MNIRPLFASLAFLLSACVGLGSDGRSYPSLARRPVESQGAGDSDEAAPTPVPPAIVEDAALTKQINALSSQSQAGGQKFDRLFSQLSGSIRVAAGAAISSEQWVVAQQSLGRLEQARYDSVSALAGLDTLYVERMKAVADGKAVGGVEQIGLARDTALAMVDSQNDRVDQLRAALRQP